ncbi:DUF5320 domain-containing protein [Helicovermis profundi]|uniref:Uncharacterized protein n=1 Tax=Helicovermis profundi TaxID=3065157 RepID=A0AAU9E6A8_9FIRM|nr:hypothetical protein HLPR_12490 [Clostridia bacterium S502]
MANFNRRGPNEEGPMTGRGLGDCNSRTTTSNTLPRRNFRLRNRTNVNDEVETDFYGNGRGFGRGRGRRNSPRTLQGRGRRFW